MGPALALLWASAAGALACDGCSSLDARFEGGAHKLAIVTVARAHFLDDEGVQQKAYVVQGDELIAMRLDQGKVHASFISERGRETKGWLACGSG